MHARRTVAAAVAFACVALCAHRVARAASPSDIAAAQALFEDGRKLAAAGKWTEACQKLEASQKLDPGAGTEYHLADCYDHVGRTASAWAAFLQVAAESKTAGRADRETVARQRAAAIEPKLVRVQVRLSEGARAQSPTVSLDGKPLVEGSFGTPLPVDPGSHVVSASAAGCKDWQQPFDLTNGGETKSLEVPPLETSAPAPPPPPAPAPPASTPTSTPASTTTPTPTPTAPEHPASSSSSFGRTLGIAMAVVGVAGLAAGSYFGLQSFSKHSDSQPHCSGNVCDATGVSLRNDAITDGNYSTIAFAAGGALVAGGLALWLGGVW